MMIRLSATLILGLLVAHVAVGAPSRKVVPPAGGEDWGYIDVRTGAHMFYWLYTSTAAPDPTTLPIILWLQGGPGGSSTAYGNFEEMGPLDVNLQPRNSSWVHHANLVFIDNPVGAGYSYADNLADLATDTTQIAIDLVEFMRQFYVTYPEFLNTPVYCFSQSYGGKMAAFFGLEMDRAIKAGEIVSNFKGVALGSAWISPIDSTTSWAPYLLQTGIIDTRGHDFINNFAAGCRDLVNNGQWTEATQCWSDTEIYVLIYGHNVDFYNILYRTPPIFLQEILEIKDPRKRAYKLANRGSKAVEDLMNGPIYDKLSATLPYLNPWDAQGDAVFDANWDDFMKPAINAVERLLDETELTVAVDNGQLDLICDTPSQVVWSEAMNWSQVGSWLSASRNAFTVDGLTEGYNKRFGRFSFWWINRSGHSVPFDNPWGSIVMMRDVVGLPPQKNVEFNNEEAESK
ncbi:retinoid-inducible serine carboxypeptidase-like [Neocloeon triangulifer]|uniref:retinoid-inducible serine carboxypeptidase-like n=1 Tax=Neocloeon triangulifer TaxID=2078957 RepID=UPI00286F515B|nr:retinoid-inducible serine carboxypeptidase-like [Neocloeon triangulifer]